MSEDLYSKRHFADVIVDSSFMRSINMYCLYYAVLVYSWVSSHEQSKHEFLH